MIVAAICLSSNGSPAKNAHDQLGCESMIGGRKVRVARRVQQFRSVGVLALNSKQNVESRDAGGRDRHPVLGSQRPVTNPASRRSADGTHGRSRATAMCFLPSGCTSSSASAVPSPHPTSKWSFSTRSSPRRKRMMRPCRIPNVQILATKGSEGAGPGLEPTQAITNFLCGVVKIDSAVFFFEDGRESCFLVILWPRLDRACLQSAQGFDHEVCADCSQCGSQSFGGIRGIDWNFFLQQDIAGIESRVDSHGRDCRSQFHRERSPTGWARPRDTWATTMHAD